MLPASMLPSIMIERAIFTVNLMIIKCGAKFYSFNKVKLD